MGISVSAETGDVTDEHGERENGDVLAKSIHAQRGMWRTFAGLLGRIVGGIAEKESQGMEEAGSGRGKELREKTEEEDCGRLSEPV